VKFKAVVKNLRHFLLYGNKEDDANEADDVDHPTGQHELVL
jgi:hypothetical protein